MKGCLIYNENKVAAGQAELILGSGFATEVDRLDLWQKLRRFGQLTSLRPTVKTNCIHVSLNFDSSEKLDSQTMQKIAVDYMEGIGFGDQPFLGYRHHDAGHQHMHLVSTSIRSDGSCISLHNIAREKSEPIRKAIELDYGLLVAEKKSKKVTSGVYPVDPGKIDYGRLGTKKAISGVLEGVMYSYRFETLAEFNALLHCFNVTADRGEEESEMYKKRGLVYSVLDGRGNKVGVPLKASSFHLKPTLSSLEKIFERNKQKPRIDASKTAKKVERVLSRFERVTRGTLLSELKKVGVELVIRENASGMIYGTSYVDHAARCVFKGSSLGKGCGAKAIAEIVGSSDLKKTYLRPASGKGFDLTATWNQLKGLSPLTSLLRETNDPVEPSFKRKRKRRS